MSEAIKFLLPDDKIPKAWYNIVADLPQPLPPVLNAATGKPSVRKISRRCFRWR